MQKPITDLLGPNIKLFAGNSNPELAQEIADCLGKKLADSSVVRFADGEVCVDLNETVRGCDVFVIQSTCPPVNDALMELLLMIDAFKRASAGRIFAVVPYYGYARQDRKAKPREPIAAKLVADLLTIAGVSGVLTIDLHAKQIQGFFDIPVDHLMAMPVLAEHYLERHFEGPDLVVVSPDLGSVARARSFAKKLNAPLAIIDKRRPKPNQMEVMNIIGDVAGKRAIVIDDLVDTAGTFVGGVQALVDAGAKEVYGCATHGLFSRDAIAKIEASPLKELVITNTVPLSEEKKACSKIRVLSVAPVLAKAILYICEDQPMSHLSE
jgi:ribose-phosphate pyrophosphokinase